MLLNNGNFILHISVNSLFCSNVNLGPLVSITLKLIVSILFSNVSLLKIWKNIK